MRDCFRARFPQLLALGLALPLVEYSQDSALSATGTFVAVELVADRALSGARPRQLRSLATLHDLIRRSLRMSDDGDPQRAPTPRSITRLSKSFIA